MNGDGRRRPALHEFDWHILLTALVLAAIGVVFIWSTTRTPEGGSMLWARQMLYVGASLPLVALLVRMPYPLLSRLAVPCYLLCCAVLIFLLLRSGGEVRRTNAWIRLPLGFSLQPSEFAKVAVIVALAAYLRYRERPRRLRDLVGPFAVTAFPMLLVARQPDLGSAALFVPVVLAMVYAAGAPARLLLGLLSLGAALGIGLYFSPLLHEYQRVRIQAYFESIPDKTREAQRLRAEGSHGEAAQVEQVLRTLKLGPKHQVYHAMISIGSGGFRGKGIGQGPHNHGDYLPERHNDFIFAVAGEEWGFLGCSALLFAYLLLVWLILGVARRTRDDFGRLLCVGVAALFGFQIFLNTGVATGLLPVTGVTLPFLSAGGSSMLASFLALGIVLSVGSHRVTSLGGRTYQQRVIGEA